MRHITTFTFILFCITHLNAQADTSPDTQIDPDEPTYDVEEPIGFNPYDEENTRVIEVSIGCNECKEIGEELQEAYCVAWRQLKPQNQSLPDNSNVIEVAVYQ